MKRLLKYLPLALLFLACDNTTVPRADYDALEAYTKELEAENDSLRFENSDLRLYNDHLEAELDSLEHQQ
jgi:NAD-dependent DNA ligase